MQAELASYSVNAVAVGYSGARQRYDPGTDISGLAVGQAMRTETRTGAVE